MDVCVLRRSDDLLLRFGHNPDLIASLGAVAAPEATPMHYPSRCACEGGLRDPLPSDFVAGTGRFIDEVLLPDDAYTSSSAWRSCSQPGHGAVARSAAVVVCPHRLIAVSVRERKMDARSH